MCGGNTALLGVDCDKNIIYVCRMKIHFVEVEDAMKTMQHKCCDATKMLN